MSIYEAWRITYQSSEAAARAAYKTVEKLDAELTELREQMQAIGAGGVEQLRKPKQGMTAQDRLDAIRTHHMRVGKIICMASATSTRDGNLVTEELIDDLLGEMGVHHPSMAPLLKSLAALIDEGEDDMETCLMQLADEGFHGYAVEFDSPSKPCGDNPYFCSYYSTWVYADTIDEAWQMGIEWAKKIKARVEREYAA